jgi:hypothetical protein
MHVGLQPKRNKKEERHEKNDYPEEHPVVFVDARRYYGSRQQRQPPSGPGAVL